ncbi:MAG: hypothetical protein IJS29_10565 [Selenomonadaceae bacterium]|nr:hypothetical protein [Selenomonadaceae bacterium]
MELALSNNDTASPQNADFTSSTGRKKVSLEGGAQDVKFNDEGGNVAVIGSDSSGEKNVELGNGGDLVIVEETEAPVNITAGTGSDSIVTAGNNVKINMNGGATKIIPNSGNVEVENYDPTSKAGIQIDSVSDITRALQSGSIVLEDGTISFGDAKVKVNDEESESTTVNLYDNKGKKQKVVYTHSNGGNVDLSAIKENLVMKSNGGNSSFTSGIGNDVAFGGSGDTFDLGAGYNHIELDTNRGDSNGATIRQTTASGRTEVFGFSFGFSDSNDKIGIDFSADISYSNGKLTFKYSNAALIVSGTSSLADLASSADLESSGISQKVLIGDNRRQFRR